MTRGARLAGLAGCGILLAAALLWLTARKETESLSRPTVAANAAAAARGAAAFEGAGFGGVSMDALATNAVPWRVIAAALVLEEQAHDPEAPLTQSTLGRVLARFGFLTPAQIVNGPATAPPSTLPLGFTYGDVSPVGGTQIRVANLGCAACHAGVTYDADGRPRPDRAMLGMPNSSIDLEAYTMAVFTATRDFIGSDRLLPAIDALFPGMGWRERQSLRLLVIPLAKRRLATLAGAHRPMPFPNGAPGSTNGVAALKAALKTPLIAGGTGDAGAVSIPDLGDRVWRTSLLADGAYAVPGAPRQEATTPASLDERHLRALAAITTFFTVPSMGVHPDAALNNLDDMADVLTFLKGYRPQRFPGAIDQTAAEKGRILYAQACAACHGSYDRSLSSPRLLQFPNWLGKTGTDRLRATAFDADLAAAVSKTAYRDKIAVGHGTNYAAPPLTGIWASAPYLHNGSVPTLEALLSPETRPVRFMVGGHALDFARVGLKLDASGAYPDGYRPFSRPAWIDTRSRGRGNGGHRYGENLSPEDKHALIEYLKLL